MYMVNYITYKSANKLEKHGFQEKKKKKLEKHKPTNQLLK